MNIQNKFRTAIRFWFFIAYCLLPTTNSFSQGAWVQKTSLPALPRTSTVGGFTIGNKGYAGLGLDGITYYNDWWEYDPVNNAWTQKANFPGIPRGYIAEFAIGNYGYLGTGATPYGGPYTLYNDFWRYDPVSNIWTQIANVPGAPRMTCSGFSIAGKGYLVGGQQWIPGAIADVFEYDPATNVWTQKNNFAGGVRADIDHIAVVICNKAYLGTGADASGTHYNDWWEYDPASDTWTAKANFPGLPRHGGCAFSICDMGFAGLGSNYFSASADYNDMWMYDPAANSWSAVTSYPGCGNVDVGRFVINNKAYLVGGSTGQWIGPNLSCNDVWEYTPPPLPCTNTLSLTASPTTLCTGQSTTLTASGGNSYSWSPGGQTSSSIVVTPTSTTYYSVTDPTNACVSQQGVIIIVSSPIAVASNSTICAGQTATLTASGGNPYSWNTGATTSSITVSPSATTNYSVIVGSGSCADTATATVTIASSVIAAATNSTICAGQSATLSASGGNPYSWNTGATTSSITVSPSATTNYSVIVGSGSCADTATATVTVNNAPAPVITGNISLCTGDIATLTASGGNTYSWSNGSTANPISVNPSSSTSYTVVATNASGCTSSTTVNVTVSPSPVASVSGATICSGWCATLIGSGGGSYSWNTGNTSAAIVVCPAINTTYSVIVAIGSCADTASAIVTVIPSPSVSISGNTTLCVGDIAALTASGSNNYSWSNGSSATIINVSPSATTTYTVTTSNGNCASTTSITVFVSPPPIAAANNVTICDGQTAILTAYGGGNYSWSNGATTSSITVAATAAATYSVIVSIGSCSDTASATITVNPSPAASAFSNVTITQGQSTTLSASGGGTYLWSNGSTANPITVSPPVTTIYCVTVTQSNCSDTACVTVTVEPIFCGYADDQLFVPDAFSPNNDTKNDVFGVYYPNISCIKEFMLIIYDRWGEKVFEADNVTALWDGTYKGKLMNTAVFVYYMKVSFITGNEVIRKGNISLIR